jgi:probable O-glycosylation ligase (exosortase A-associated)
VISGSLAFFGVKGGIFTILSGGAHRVQGPPGSFLDGNTFLGVALIMGLPLFVAFARNTKNKWWLRASYAGFWLTVLSIAFTYSRGALLGLGTVAPFLFMGTKRKLLVAIALAPLVVFGISMAPEALFERAATIQTYEQDLSALERLSAWSVAKNVALSHPFGGGFVLDATPMDKWMAYSEYAHLPWWRVAAAHSIYFQVLGEHGFPGLAMWLLILFGTLITLQRVKRLALYRRDGQWLADYAAAIQIGLIGYAVSGAFVSLAYFDLFYTYVVLGAILLREAREVERNPQITAAPNTVGAITSK